MLVGSRAPVRTGEAAPGFVLPDQHGTPVSREELVSGGGAILIFVPSVRDASARPAYEYVRKNRELYRQQGAEMLLVSLDDQPTNAAAAEEQQLRVAVLSDADRRGAAAWGLLREGSPERISGLFFYAVGADGMVHYASAGLPPATEVIVALRSQQGRERPGFLGDMF